MPGALYPVPPAARFPHPKLIGIPVALPPVAVTVATPLDSVAVRFVEKLIVVAVPSDVPPLSTVTPLPLGQAPGAYTPAVVVDRKHSPAVVVVLDAVGMARPDKNVATVIDSSEFAAFE